MDSENNKLISSNDIERLKNRSSVSSNNDSSKKIVESRSHDENERLADMLIDKFNAKNSRLAFLAVAYSGIPSKYLLGVLSTTALEKGNDPVKLFMHLVSREPQWKVYKDTKNRKLGHE